MRDLRLCDQAIHGQPLLSYPTGGNEQRVATLVVQVWTEPAIQPPSTIADLGDCTPAPWFTSNDISVIGCPCPRSMFPRSHLPESANVA